MTDLTIQHEPYHTFIADAEPLLPKHWQELALYQDDIPLQPDLAFYKRAAFAGMCHVWTVRQKSDNALVGYAVYFIKAHHHYAGHKWAISDIFWLHPDYRRGGYGKELFATVERDLKELGVAVMHSTLKTEHPAAAFVLEALGHKKVEVGYSKKLL